MAERCEQDPGVFQPLIDRERCEGKTDCVAACPYDVFEVRRLEPDERATLGWIARLKVFVHGGRQAFAIRADACRACGQCVTACPENAIRLVGGY